MHRAMAGAMENGLLATDGREALAPSKLVHLQLRNLTYHVMVGGKKEKQIIFGVDADFEPGRLTAVMGPSGAGKTTILNILTLNAGGRVGGQVLANGRSIERGFKQVMNIVPQEDVLLPALTVYETLSYAASLRMPSTTSQEARNIRVRSIISDLNLKECAETPVGSVEKRGISGGQRKRVSVGLEMTTSPAALFLDEPTSGLDSKAAEDICNILRELAGAGRVVVCTVHQPSWKIFSGFNDLLLLAMGRTVYRGEATRVPEHFQQLGFQSPPNENPIDYVMRVIQEDDPTKFASQFGPLEPVVPAESLREAYRYPNSMWLQISVLFRRNCHDFVKDKEKFAALCFLKIAVSVLIGLCWWQTASPPKASKAFTVTGLMFMFTMNCIMDNLFDTVIRFPLTKALLLREYKNGCYSSFSWYVAYLVQTLLFQVLFTLCLLVPAYFMVGLRVERMALAGACLLLASCIGITAGLLMGIVAKDLQTAQGMLLPAIVPMILFCGYVIPRGDIPVFFQWFYYIDVFQFAFSILRMNQFDGLVFEDCPPLGTPGAFCFCLGPDSVCTGVDFLRTQSLDPADHSVAMYFLYMAIIWAAVLLPSFAAVRWKANQKNG